MLWHVITICLLSIICCCPCDRKPYTCDLNCCCDESCTRAEIQSFTCQSFLISDPLLCCKDYLQPRQDGTYGKTKVCSNSLGCLKETPKDYGVFQSDSAMKNVANIDLGGGGIEINEEREQYTTTDVLLHGNNQKKPFLFPISLSNRCVKSPVLFYRNLDSKCSRTFKSLKGICDANTILDYSFYLTSSLLKLNKSTDSIDLSDIDNITFYCKNNDNNVAAICDENQEKIPVFSVPNRCNNVVSDVTIRLYISKDSMSLVNASVIVTLTSVTVNSLNQRFVIEYKSQTESPTTLKSGNFGYRIGSELLSGIVTTARKVEMNSIPEVRAISLISPVSAGDCERVQQISPKFGVDFYTGCKLSLNTLNFHYMSPPEDITTYCNFIKNLTSVYLADVGLNTVVGKCIVMQLTF